MCSISNAGHIEAVSGAHCSLMWAHMVISCVSANVAIIVALMLALRGLFCF